MKSKGRLLPKAVREDSMCVILGEVPGGLKEGEIITAFTQGLFFLSIGKALECTIILVRVNSIIYRNQ